MARTADQLTDKVGENGLRLNRHFTASGVNPFDELEWEIRDARIGPAASPAFEQKDLEFPKTWSQNATNIVAQKYFRGPLEAPQRERSVKQMIIRVVRWYTTKGAEDRYFASSPDAEIFQEELIHLLVNQKMAFNSPVWFNVGLVEPPRVSACFILDVDDEMGSILNWYTEEGLIFKAGSGAGINLSNLRSSKEQLSSGGTASGPVSFMRGADASAGTIKSGGSTRRAAKMVVLDVDHPDVEEFIWCKAHEEKKARALRAAGFDMDLDGRDSYSLQYQNANNSVGLTDEFLEAYLNDDDWDLKAVKDGRVIKTVKARDLMRQIAQAAWDCADPGVFYLTTMNKWHTSPAEGRIRATNPCGEYVRPANTSCNLASLRLTKFLSADGTFNVEDFVSAVETTLTAMDISVTNAEYPTPKITDMVANYRELGLGFTDLGALLMDQGVAYDSDAGRAWAASITALMAGAAYRRSAELAAALGPYPGWTKPGNAEAHLDVIRRHRDALSGIDKKLAPAHILEAARREWDLALEQGTIHGFRNAQTTLIAPTGTISFLMDADTTGIEPDLALVKMKKLVGGGTMRIVNQRVPSALKRLGYKPHEISEIVAHVAEHGSVREAPFLKNEHQSVFHCAMGDSPIHYMGHVKMMAAVQPFLCGSISKTVNMPEDVAIEDIEQIYIEGWRMGLKNMALYRDNCKVAQPLNVGKKDSAAADPAQAQGSAVSAPVPAAPLSASADLGAAAPAFSPVASGAADGASGGAGHSSPRVSSRAEAAGHPAASGRPGSEEQPKPVRRRLPRKRSAKTMSFRIADCDGYVTAGEYPDTGELGEIFLKVAKQGSTLAGIMDAFAISVSLGLQYGVPLKAYVDKFINMRFEPSGVTDDADFRFASSLVDYIFRRLAADYLPPEEREAINVKTTGERQAQLSGLPPQATETADGGSSQVAGGSSNRESVGGIDANDYEPGAASSPAANRPDSKAANGGSTNGGGTDAAGGMRSLGGPASPGSNVLGALKSKELSFRDPGSVDAPFCFTCGISMRPAGSCFVCESCGTTSGCS